MDAIYFTGYEEQLVLINHSCNHIAERHVIQRGGKGPIKKIKILKNYTMILHILIHSLKYVNPLQPGGQV